MATASKAPKTPAPKPARVARLVLLISGVEYVVRPVPGSDLAEGVQRAWRLTRSDRKGRRTTHTVSAGVSPSRCTCPDTVYHSSGRPECKHLAAAHAVGLI